MDVCFSHFAHFMGKEHQAGPLDVTYLEGLFGSTGFGTCVSGSEITVPDPGPDQRWKSLFCKNTKKTLYRPESK
jgi:hypothetical protein